MIQHNILTINIKCKKQELVLQLHIRFENDVTYILLLHECLYLIKVKWISGSYIRNISGNAKV